MSDTLTATDHDVTTEQPDASGRWLCTCTCGWQMAVWIEAPEPVERPGAS